MKIKKISVVTVCLNVRDSIRLTLESVRAQSFENIEHVIIDGGSNDGTQDIAMEYNPGYFVSEPDGGVYDAMDKGAKAATGDILIFLNAGDTFFDNETCADVATFFEDSRADIVFGNIMPVYLRPTDKHDHGAFVPGKLLDLGYVQNRRQLYDESIHHQATFYRRWIFDQCTFACEPREATGEYNVLLKAVLQQGARVKHIARPVSRFVLGGISTRDFAKEWAKYARARDILRQMYFPAGKNVRLANKLEFVHRGAANTGAPTINPTSLKQRIKGRIKRSFVFRMYDRLAVGLTSRVVNSMSPIVETVAERQAQRIYNDLKVTVESNLERRATGEQDRLQARRIYRDLRSAIDAHLTALLAAHLDSHLQTNLAPMQSALASIEAEQRKAAQILDEVRVSGERASYQMLVAIERLKQQHEQLLLNQATLRFADKRELGFNENGFRVFSQWDEDGLIHYLVSRIPNIKRRFIEFGVGDYIEANTRLLLERENWVGMVMDCSAEAVERIRSSPLYWRHSLTAVCAFVDRDNINQLIADNGFAGEIGLLSIDVDGVDYWIWDALTAASPQIVICEYNGAFGSVARVTVPYRPDFDRGREHYSMVYAGASLAALQWLGHRKGYTLVGTNTGGNNAFFVRNDVLAASTIRVSDPLYTRPRFREARNADGTLAYLDIADAVREISDKTVVDVESGEAMPISEITISYDPWMLASPVPA